MTWRWTWHPWGPMCCGLLSALVAVYLIQLYIEQQLARQHQPDITPPQQSQEVELVVASRPLEAGQIISMAMISARQVAPAGVAADTFRPAEAGWLVGQQLAHPVVAGQPIQQLHLATQHSERQFSELLKPGERALTLNVGPQQSHAGLIRVGDKVDFFDLSLPRPRLLDNAIAVIATGAHFQPASPNTRSTGDEIQPEYEYRTLTFAINADKVPVYEVLQRNHHLAFWLRAPEDYEVLSESRSDRDVDWIIGGRQLDQAEPLSGSPWL